MATAKTFATGSTSRITAAPFAPCYPTPVWFGRPRPGHHRRYAMDTRKIERELKGHPLETFESGIRKTVRWYLEHEDWVRDVTSGSYRQWMAKHYATERLEENWAEAP